jgi:hypothetical protein
MRSLRKSSRVGCRCARNLGVEIRFFVRARASGLMMKLVLGFVVAFFWHDIVLVKIGRRAIRPLRGRHDCAPHAASSNCCSTSHTTSTSAMQRPLLKCTSQRGVDQCRPFEMPIFFHNGNLAGTAGPSSRASPNALCGPGPVSFPRLELGKLGAPPVACSATVATGLAT